jgi:hypothetical protein
MMKAAVFAGALVLGFASAAQAVDVTFSGAGISTGGSDTDLVSPVDGGNYTLTYLVSGTPAGVPHYYNNTGGNFWYGTSGTTVDVAYLPGSGGTWQVTIAADPGFEIVFDGFTMGRYTQAGAVNVSYTVNGTTNDETANTAFGGNHIFTRSFAAGTKPTGSSVILSYVDSADVAMDSYSFTVQAIPEPTVLAPLALAGMGMVLRRRRA